MFSCLTNTNQGPKSNVGIGSLRQHGYRYLVDSYSEEAMAKHQQEDIILSEMMARNRAEAQLTERREQWLAENSEEISAYNEHVEANGVFSDNVRSF